VGLIRNLAGEKILRVLTAQEHDSLLNGGEIRHAEKNLFSGFEQGEDIFQRPFGGEEKMLEHLAEQNKIVCVLREVGRLGCYIAYMKRDVQGVEEVPVQIVDAQGFNSCVGELFDNARSHGWADLKNPIPFLNLRQHEDIVNKAPLMGFCIPLAEPLESLIIKLSEELFVQSVICVEDFCFSIQSRLRQKFGFQPK